MIYRIEFSKEADKTLKKWKKSNPRLFNKAKRLLLDIMEHPRTGLGHPEPLVGGMDVTYSRHITANDRIIYDYCCQVKFMKRFKNNISPDSRYVWYTYEPS